MNMLYVNSVIYYIINNSYANHGIYVYYVFTRTSYQILNYN